MASRSRNPLTDVAEFYSAPVRSMAPGARAVGEVLAPGLTDALTRGRAPVRDLPAVPGKAPSGDPMEASLAMGIAELLNLAVPVAMPMAAAKVVGKAAGTAGGMQWNTISAKSAASALDYMQPAQILNILNSQMSWQKALKVKEELLKLNPGMWGPAQHAVENWKPNTPASAAANTIAAASTPAQAAAALAPSKYLPPNAGALKMKPSGEPGDFFFQYNGQPVAEVTKLEGNKFHVALPGDSGPGTIVGPSQVQQTAFQLFMDAQSKPKATPGTMGAMFPNSPFLQQQQGWSSMTPADMAKQVWFSPNSYMEAVLGGLSKEPEVLVELGKHKPTSWGQPASAASAAADLSDSAILAALAKNPGASITDIATQKPWKPGSAMSGITPAELAERLGVPPGSTSWMTEGVYPASGGGYRYGDTLPQYVPDRPNALAPNRPSRWEVRDAPFQDASGWNRVGDQLGSNPGGVFENPSSGQRFYVKTPRSDDHLNNELLAAELYRLAGVQVPEFGRTTLGGKNALVSPWMEGALLRDAKTQDFSAIQRGFPADAWLGNWDTIGLNRDNILMGPSGPVRIDPGGSLRFRAQGEPKEFSSQVGELASIPAKQPEIFGNMPNLQADATALMYLPDSAIADAVRRYGPQDASERARLLDNLYARRDYIASKLGTRGPSRTAEDTLSHWRDIAPHRTLALRGSGQTPSQSVRSGHGQEYFSTQSPELANLYSQTYSSGLYGNANVHRRSQTQPLALDTRNYLDYDAQGLNWGDAQSASFPLARKQNRHGVIMRNVYDEPDSSKSLPAQTVFATFPEGKHTVRSRFAQFNPARYGENDLLAGLAGGGIIVVGADGIPYVVGSNKDRPL